jgi:hypothetical protein
MTKSISIAIVVSLAAIGSRAANPLPQTFTCAQQGSSGGLGAGTDLTRYTVDTTVFPEAVCNDGTPAVFYYAPSSKAADRDKWIIFLQGGGGCYDGQSCAERWCSVNTNYGFDKMSTSIAKAQIQGNGFLNPTPLNQFGSWNRVLIYYCSSDTWTGTSTKTVSAALNNGQARDYTIYFKGSRIIDAVLDTLRNARPGGRRHATHHEVGGQGDASAWPDLDSATAVLFAGSSAGGAGTRANLDRVGAKLRSTNPTLDFRGLVDAIYSPLGENRDFTKSIYCVNDPSRGCRYDTYTQAARQEIDFNLLAARNDESCEQWHASHAPGTEWRCSDGEHVNLNHITTPFFIRQDEQDSNIGGDYVSAGFGSAVDYGTHVEDELRNMQTPEETRGATPGLFVPQCTDHESFTNDDRVFRTKVNGISFHDAVWNWWTHAQPQQVIRAFTGTPGKAPECP